MSEQLSLDSLLCPECNAVLMWGFDWFAQSFRACPFCDWNDRPSWEEWAARDLAMLVGIEMYNDTSKLEICREWLKMEVDHQPRGERD